MHTSLCPDLVAPLPALIVEPGDRQAVEVSAGVDRKVPLDRGHALVVVAPCVVTVTILRAEKVAFRVRVPAGAHRIAPRGECTCLVQVTAEGAENGAENVATVWRERFDALRWKDA